MTIVRTVAVAVLLGATAVGFAGPAWSDELTAGFYSVTRSGVTQPGTAPMMWSVHPCGTGCVQVVGDNSVTWDARLADGRWTATRHSADAVDCRNGTSAPGTSVFSLDAQTLKGTIVSTSDGPACGSPVPITGAPEIFFMGKA
jgi:hypothetical protein